MTRPPTWRTSILLAVPPRCPWCGRALHPDGWLIWQGVAGCLDCIGGITYMAMHVPLVVVAGLPVGDRSGAAGITWYCPTDHVEENVSTRAARLLTERRFPVAVARGVTHDQYFGRVPPPDPPSDDGD
jgi:hypothetical protein